MDDQRKALKQELNERERIAMEAFAHWLITPNEQYKSHLDAAMADYLETYRQLNSK